MFDRFFWIGIIIVGGIMLLVLGFVTLGLIILHKKQSAKQKNKRQFKTKKTVSKKSMIYFFLLFVFIGLVALGAYIGFFALIDVIIEPSNRINSIAFSCILAIVFAFFGTAIFLAILTSIKQRNKGEKIDLKSFLELDSEPDDKTDFWKDSWDNEL
ncbi:MAG: hypothetical protein FWE13_03445 [Firmicutes bacterium]|nr:hypothetical protein [Bacillota bacterium]